MSGNVIDNFITIAEVSLVAGSYSQISLHGQPVSKIPNLSFTRAPTSSVECLAHAIGVEENVHTAERRSTVKLILIVWNVNKTMMNIFCFIVQRISLANFALMFSIIFHTLNSLFANLPDLGLIYMRSKSVLLCLITNLPDWNQNLTNPWTINVINVTRSLKLGVTLEDMSDPYTLMKNTSALSADPNFQGRTTWRLTSESLNQTQITSFSVKFVIQPFKKGVTIWDTARCHSRWKENVKSVQTFSAH